MPTTISPKIASLRNSFDNAKTTQMATNYRNRKMLQPCPPTIKRKCLVANDEKLSESLPAPLCFPISVIARHPDGRQHSPVKPSLTQTGPSRRARLCKRRLVTKRALWHSGRPVRRFGGPRNSRDLGFLQMRSARRARNRPCACHRVRFVTNLRVGPGLRSRPFSPSPP